MAASSAPSKVSLKLLIDTNAQKVLFAEANKEFVDFLFYILSLPVGTVIRLLKKNSLVGSLGNLYDSIKSLSDTYMEPNQSKDSILNPKIANYGPHVSLLLTDDDDNDNDDDDDDNNDDDHDDEGDDDDDDDYIVDEDDDGNDDVDDDDDSMARKVYSCHNYHSYVTDDPTTVCPQCKSRMDIELHYVAGDGAEILAGGGFVREMVTYMIMDDLVVDPMSTVSSIALLNKFNVKEVGSLEEKVVSLKMNEGLKLLKASLQCKNVLTTVFLA